MASATRRYVADLIAVVLMTMALVMNAHSQSVRLRAADFVLSNSVVPPPDTDAWQPVELPDVWEVSRPEAKGAGWYRLKWLVDGHRLGPQALYIPKIFPTDAVYLNGIRVGGAGFQDLARVLDPTPHIYVLPASVLNSRTNIIHVRIVSHRMLGLMPIQVGDANDIRKIYELQAWIDVKGPHQLFGVALALGVFMLMLWLKRPTESAFAYFGGASLSYAVWLLVTFDTEQMGLLQSLKMAAVLSPQLVNVFTFMYALRYTGLRMPILEMALWLSIPIGIGVGDIETVNGSRLDVYYWFVAAPVFIGYVVVFLWNALIKRSAESAALTVASTGCFITFILYPNGLGLGGPDYPYAFAAYSYVPLFLMMGWLLVRRFAQSLQESEKLNVELEQRVASKQEELQRNYLAMEKMSREAAVVEERRRIMGDMHDGIGGQLISTLSLVEHGQGSTEDVVSALRECIDDLRLAIDSLEPTEDDLLTVLGNLRYRLEGRLGQNGIALDWDVTDVPKLSTLTPQNVLQILRILQEAFTNVLKHAHATRIRVATAVHQDRVSIDISDNGRGFSEAPQQERRGRGLGNMKDRARKIGGDLVITAGASGTKLCLMLPIG